MNKAHELVWELDRVIDGKPQWSSFYAKGTKSDPFVMADFAAVVMYGLNEVGFVPVLKIWKDSNGHFHRDSGPAYVGTFSVLLGIDMYYHHGVLHRTTGPARVETRIDANGKPSSIEQSYSICGMPVSEEFARSLKGATYEDCEMALKYYNSLDV